MQTERFAMSTFSENTRVELRKESAITVPIFLRISHHTHLNIEQTDLKINLDH